jgi:uncharacterized membrane protein YuzA (DUF378 family)
VDEKIIANTVVWSELIMKHSHYLEMAVAILLIVGGLEWGFVGLFGSGILGSVFGGMPAFMRILYVLVGLAAVYRIAMWVKARSAR